MRHIQNLIGTERKDPSGEALDLVDPSTGEVFASAGISTEQDVQQACEAALEAFQTWKHTTPSVRQQALLKIADLVEEHADELVDLETENTGKPVAVTNAEEIPPMVDQIKFFAGAARVLEGKSAGEYMEGFTSYVRREPVGVVGQVAPWNYPLMMAVWKFAPAIAAGNTVVLKPSDTTPVSTARLAQLIQEAEALPPGVFNVVVGDRTTGAALIENPIPSMVSITGSVGAGKKVAEAASRTVKRVHLELGGKAPVLVFNDVDVAKAAEWLAFTAFFNAGQDCTAPTRFIVQSGIHDEFLAALTEQVKALDTTYENGRKDPDALVPPTNNINQFNTVMGFLDRAPAHAEVLAGGHRIGDHGFYIEPTLLANMRQDDEMVQREVFGPVITAQKFETEAEALALANGVNLALASSVWTRDHGTALRTSRDLDFGCVWINTHIPLQAEMPHGGYKESGYGKDLSMYGLEDYTRIKHVMSSLDA
jgi:betaine-aldehyde dehydrogenase